MNINFFFALDIATFKILESATKSDISSSTVDIIMTSFFLYLETYELYLLLYLEYFALLILLDYYMVLLFLHH